MTAPKSDPFPLGPPMDFRCVRSRRASTRRLALTLAHGPTMFVLSSLVLVAILMAGPAAAAVLNNDNRQPAGQLVGDVLTLRMVTQVGDWRPRGDQGTALPVAAFGEEEKSLTVPGPLIRVPEGTTMALTLRNGLSSELRVFGLCAKPGPCTPCRFPAGPHETSAFS
jgi:FtsP/CotA-like multicopper oxidase with cupredoxin domain